MYPIKKSTSAQVLLFFMVDSTDHVTGKTGLSPTVTISKNGAAFASPSGAVSEISGGWYKVAGNATDSNTLGPLALHATGTGADPTDTLYYVTELDPQDAVRAGLTALPNANAEAAGGLFTRGSGAGQINQQTNGQVDTNVARWLNTAVATPNTNGVPIVDDRFLVRYGTSQSTGLSVTEIILDAGASAVNDFYLNLYVTIVGGTGKGQTRLIDGYTGASKTATVSPPFTDAPNNDSVFIISAQVPSGAMTWQGEVANPLITGRLDVQAIIAAGAINAGSFAAGAIDAAALAASAGTEIATAVWASATRTLTSGTQVATDVWAATLEGAYTATQLVKLMSAALVGKLSGAGTTSITIRDVNDTKDRITATVDANGNRTAVTKDVS